MNMTPIGGYDLAGDGAPELNNQSPTSSREATGSAKKSASSTGSNGISPRPEAARDAAMSATIVATPTDRCLSMIILRSVDRRRRRRRAPWFYLRSRSLFHDRRPALTKKEPCFGEKLTQPLQRAERECSTLR